MSKYSQAELKDMAKTLVRCKETGDSRYLEFVMTVALRAGVDPNVVIKKIEEFAEAEIEKV